MVRRNIPPMLRRTCGFSATCDKNVTLFAQNVAILTDLGTLAHLLENKTETNCVRVNHSKKKALTNQWFNG